MSVPVLKIDLIADLEFHPFDTADLVLSVRDGNDTPAEISFTFEQLLRQMKEICEDEDQYLDFISDFTPKVKRFLELLENQPNGL